MRTSTRSSRHPSLPGISVLLFVMVSFAGVPHLEAQQIDLTEHQRIDFLIGEWYTASEFPDGRAAQGELSYRWVLGGEWMKVEFSGDHPGGGPWEAHGMQRWNPEQNAYEAWVFAAPGPPIRFHGTSDGPGHFRIEQSLESGGASGIDYRLQDDGSVHQENWITENGERRVTLETRYRSSPAPPRSQSGIPMCFSAADADGEAADVLAVVDRLFEGMRARDGSMLEEIFHPDARMLVAPPAPGDPSEVPIRTVEGFIEMIDAPGEPLHEPYFAPEVTIDGHLAHVWTYYHLYRGDEFSHCGYDSFQLVRTPEGWKIVFLAYTTRTEDCG
jgi:hypothetical protein